MKAKPVTEAAPIPPKAEPDGFFPVPLWSLRPESVLDFDLYLQPSPDQAPVLYRERNLPFSEDVRHRLMERGIERLHVPSGQKTPYRLYMETNLTGLLADPDISTEVKSEVVYESATGLVAEAMCDIRVGSTLARSRALVSHVCSYMLKDKDALAGLMKVMSFDYYTYTHAVNVFTYGVALALRTGSVYGRDLQHFGEGLLLHDVGKSLIDPAIITHPGTLNAQQWSEIKRHPVYGSDILADQGVSAPVLLDVVCHHHEKLRGGGYPDGLGGSDLSFHVRLSTIADVFDALTTRRPYKPAMPTVAALRLMIGEMKGDLDRDLLEVFIRMMGDPSGGQGAPSSEA